MHPVKDAAETAKAKAKAKTKAPSVLRFDLEFQHQLTNKSQGHLVDIRVYIPVPEDCYQQKVADLVWLRDGEPTTVHIERDQYGQKVASFHWRKLPPDGNLAVGFRCRAVLQQPVRATLAQSTGAEIPQEVRAIYTRDDRIYCLASPTIRRKARELVASRKSTVERVRAIYDFVAQHLTYARQGGWDPAPEVLARKSGSCSEFSYLFSSLCRANGIPTRFVGATMFRPEQVKEYPYVDKVWHRWVQVYLPGVGWVHMDPTRDRGKTARHDFFGRQPGPALVLSHQGGSSRFLGNHYVSADNQSFRKVKRARRFSWMPIAARQVRSMTSPLRSRQR